MGAYFSGSKVLPYFAGAKSNAYYDGVKVWRSGPGDFSPFSVARRLHVAASVGNYALFGGGMSDSYLSVDAYDSAMTRTAPSVGLSNYRFGLAAATIGDYALFGPGYGAYETGNLGTTSGIVDAYNSSLTRQNPAPFGLPRYHYGAATVGKYAWFAGGDHWEAPDGEAVTVDAYNSSLVRSTPT